MQPHLKEWQISAFHDNDEAIDVHSDSLVDIKVICDAKDMYIKLDYHSRDIDKVSLSSIADSDRIIYLILSHANNAWLNMNKIKVKLHEASYSTYDKSYTFKIVEKVEENETSEI